MKLFVTLYAAVCLLLSASALGQAVHGHEMPHSTPAPVSTGEPPEPPMDSSSADTTSTGPHRHQNVAEAEPLHNHTRQNSHFMVMMGVGMPDTRSVFRTVGAAYEYRFPGWSGLVGVGITGMAMIFNDYTHFMVVGTGTIYPLGDLFFQVETGMTHAHNPDAGSPHRMALLGGVGVGHHCHMGSIAVAPVVTVEYSRVQKPTYSVMVCLGL